jgi:hypothetical protein
MIHACRLASLYSSVWKQVFESESVVVVVVVIVAVAVAVAVVRDNKPFVKNHLVSKN